MTIIQNQIEYPVEFTKKFMMNSNKRIMAVDIAEDLVEKRRPGWRSWNEREYNL